VCESAEDAMDNGGQMEGRDETLREQGGQGAWQEGEHHHKGGWRESERFEDGNDIIMSPCEFKESCFTLRVVRGL